MHGFFIPYYFDSNTSHLSHKSQKLFNKNNMATYNT